MSRLIVAIDTSDIVKAASLIEAVSPHAFAIKIGLELFLRIGTVGACAIASARRKPVMLDLKLHDTPETVGRAMRVVLDCFAESEDMPWAVTVHGAGGSAMVAAARKATEKYWTRPLVFAVTVLSTSAAGLASLIAADAIRGGADGVVTGGANLALLRDMLRAVPIIVPGIRLNPGRADGHTHPLTPHNAVKAGADYIVVGRPITGADDPAAVAALYADDAERGL